MLTKHLIFLTLGRRAITMYIFMCYIVELNIQSSWKFVEKLGNREMVEAKTQVPTCR